MTVAPAHPHSNGGVLAASLTATDIHGSEVFMAAGDINLHTRQTLATIPVTKDEVDAVRKAWVKVDQQGQLLTTSVDVLEMLRQGEPVVVVAGARGMGKTAAAVKALTEYSQYRTSTGARRDVWGSGPLEKLEHVQPDWDEPEAELLPAGRNRGYILDVCEEIGEWTDRAGAARALLAHGEELRRKGSVLIVITSPDGWPESHAPALGRIVVRATARPPGDLVAWAHLNNLYPQATPRKWLATGRDDEGRALSDLLRSDMYPCDAAARALELSRIPDSPDALEIARATVSRWRDEVKEVFTKTRDSADDRALLLAAIMLEGRAPTDILAAARLLLNEKDTKSMREILTGPDLATRLDIVRARTSPEGVSFTHKPGYAGAVLRHTWRQLSGVQDPLLNWVREITKPTGSGAGRITEIADLLARLAIDERDLKVLDVARTWAAPGHQQPGKIAAASMLAMAASDPTLGTATRNKLRAWAGKESTDTATVTAVVCQGTFATTYPRQALTCLRWILERPSPDSAVLAAETALRTMAGNLPLLPQVWATVTAWINSTGPKGPLAGRRAFLALLDPEAALATVNVLLADASADPRTADDLVTGWCAVLDDPLLADPCERLLEKWAQAVADHTIVEDAVVPILHRVVDEHMVTGPMSAFLIGKEGPAYNSPAVIALRQRLMARRLSPTHPVGGIANTEVDEA